MYVHIVFQNASVHALHEYCANIVHTLYMHGTDKTWKSTTVNMSVRKFVFVHTEYVLFYFESKSMYWPVLTLASTTEKVHCTYDSTVIQCTYSVCTSMSEYIQGVRIPDGTLMKMITKKEEGRGSCI